MVVVLTPVLCMLKLPYVMPVAMGLIGTPASCVSVSCGVVVYYLLQTVITNAPTINSMGAEEATAKLRLLIDGILGSKAMLVTIVAFTITVVVVYLIRRMSVDHSWTIAMIAGVMIEVLILLVGDLMYDTNLSIFSALLGAVVTVLVCKAIEFFRFCLDYSRTEKVQFEDDEYYYYEKDQHPAPAGKPDGPSCWAGQTFRPEPEWRTECQKCGRIRKKCSNRAYSACQKQRSLWTAKSLPRT